MVHAARRTKHFWLTFHHTSSQATRGLSSTPKTYCRLTFPTLGFIMFETLLFSHCSISFYEAFVTLLKFFEPLSSPRLVLRNKVAPLIHDHAVIPFNAFIMIVSTIMGLFLHLFDYDCYFLLASLFLLDERCSYCLNVCLYLACLFFLFRYTESWITEPCTRGPLRPS